MDQEKNDPQKNYDPGAELKSKFIFLAVVLAGMLVAKFVFGM